MFFSKKKYQVKPNMTGFLYRDNKFEQKLDPGYYEIQDSKDRTTLFCLPQTSKLITITNQEVLTKDNIALRFSFNILYKITDGERFLSKFTLDKEVIYIIVNEAETRLANIVQIYIRNRIAGMDSEELNEKRAEITNFKTEEMENEVSEFGITIEQAQLKDLTFPKTIQDLFAKQLETKIKAKTDLENARTVVATARALKNASELMKDDENLRFFQVLDTINKIAEKGKNTFMLGDINELTRIKK